MNSQRARGLKLKRALQIVTLLAICIWLLYQINHPRDNSSPSKYGEEQSIFLGHKVNIGWLAHGNKRESEARKVTETWKNGEGGVSDDRLDKSRDDMGSKIKGKELTVVLNQTGELNSNLESEDEDAMFHHRMDDHLHHGSFDDENGVPFGFDGET